MIRYGNRVRLTQIEIKRLTKITGFVPSDLKTLDDFEDFILSCKQYYWGTSPETRFLHWLIDRERQRCLSEKLEGAECF